MGLRRPRLLSARVERWQSGNSARKMKMRPSTCRIHTSYICHVHDIMLMYHPGSPQSSRYFSALLCGNTDPLRSMPQLSLHPPQPPRRRPTSLRPRRTRARTWTGLSRTPTRFRHTHTHFTARTFAPTLVPSGHASPDCAYTLWQCSAPAGHSDWHQSATIRLTATLC